MERRAEHLPDDPVLVLLDDDEPKGTFGEWLQLVTADGPTGSDAGAAEILRDIRDHGET